jgi:hypothetical protein
MKLQRVIASAVAGASLGAVAGQAQAAGSATFNGECTFPGLTVTTNSGVGFITPTSLTATLGR